MEVTRKEVENTLKPNQDETNHSILKSLSPFYKSTVNAYKRVWKIFASIADCEHAADLNRFGIDDVSDESGVTIIEGRNWSDINHFVRDYFVVRRDSMRCEFLKKHSSFCKTLYLIEL